MNPVDLFVTEFLNQFVRLSPLFDFLMVVFSRNHLIKGVVLLSLFWWGWFKMSDDQQRVRVHLLSTLIACFIAIIVGRALAFFLPYRDRPIHEPGISFSLPVGESAAMLQGWSSFPSDHAVLFFALSAGMFYISRRVGVFAVVYATVIISFPRVYLGLHYLTDILAGALIGVAIMMACNRRFFIEKVSGPVLAWSVTRPELFYPAFFILTYQIADMFNNSRLLLGVVKTLFVAATR